MQVYPVTKLACWLLSYLWLAFLFNDHPKPDNQFIYSQPSAHAHSGFTSWCGRHFHALFSQSIISFTGLPSISSSEPQPVPSSLISWSTFHSRQAPLKDSPIVRPISNRRLYPSSLWANPWLQFWPVPLLGTICSCPLAHRYPDDCGPLYSGQSG